MAMSYTRVSLRDIDIFLFALPVLILVPLLPSLEPDHQYPDSTNSKTTHQKEEQKRKYQLTLLHPKKLLSLFISISSFSFCGKSSKKVLHSLTTFSIRSSGNPVSLRYRKPTFRRAERRDERKAGLVEGCRACERGRIGRVENVWGGGVDIVSALGCSSWGICVVGGEGDVLCCVCALAGNWLHRWFDVVWFGVVRYAGLRLRLRSVAHMHVCRCGLCTYPVRYLEYVVV